MDDQSLKPADHIFLAFLLRRPRSAYELKKAAQASVNHFWAAAHSQVYQQAARLVRDGYVRDEPTGDRRGTRVLSLTPRGRRAVVAWLRKPAPLPTFASESIAKLFFAHEAGDLDATIAVMEDQRDKIVAMNADYDRMREDMVARGRPEMEVLALDLGMAVNRGAIEAHEEVIARLRDLGILPAAGSPPKPSLPRPR